MRILPTLDSDWPGAAGPGLPHSGFCNLSLNPAALPLAPVAQLFAAWLAFRPCGSTLAGVGQCPLAIGHGCLVGLPVGVPPRVGSPTAPCTLSHLAGVGQCPLAAHWQWVSSRVACRRAGSPARIATVVYIGVQWGGLGLARPGADRRQHRVPWGPGDRWSRPSLVREQLGRLRVADRQRRAAAPVSGTQGRARPVSRPGTTVDAVSAKLASSPSRPHWGQVMHDSCSCRQSRWAHRGRATNQPASGLLTTQPASGLLTTQPATAASGLLTIGRRRRRRACSWTPPTRMLPARRPGGPGTRGAGLEVITVRVHSGHDSFPVRAESARPTSAEQLAHPPFLLNPATGVNRRFYLRTRVIQTS